MPEGWLPFRETHEQLTKQSGFHRTKFCGSILVKIKKGDALRAKTEQCFTSESLAHGGVRSTFAYRHRVVAVACHAAVPSDRPARRACAGAGLLRIVRLFPAAFPARRSRDHDALGFDYNGQGEPLRRSSDFHVESVRFVAVRMQRFRRP